jgi:poly(3-hydroxyoctanoate) depolymerase
MGDLADVVVALFDELGLDQPDVLGYSFGGALAQELAHRAARRVRRLILAATMPGIGGVPPNPLPALLLLSPARYYNAGLLRLELPRIAGGRTARDPSSQLGWQAVARLCRPPDPLGYAYQLCAMTGWTSLPWLHRLTQRTLIVAGDDDPLIPVANAHLMGRLIPDARVCVLPGAGHLLLLDQPETVVDDLHAFLGE